MAFVAAVGMLYKYIEILYKFSKYCKKVYAIDIDQNKINITKNNAKVYDCPENIEYIKGDFLKSHKGVKADYVFLSPPWGGVKYKDTDVYSIKDLMTPNIYDIVRTSLKMAKGIIFYLPRTLNIDDLFGIIKTVYSEMGIKTEKIYLDVHVLKSAGKVKALMLILGHDINTDVSGVLTL
jgi:predicted RNA methylase